MKRITYLICILLTSALVAAMVGWSFAAGALLVPMIAVPLGVIVILACRQQVTTVISDERTSRIRSKAAIKTIEVLLILGVIGTAVFASYAYSAPLAPSVNGKIAINNDGTRSMTLTLTRGGFPGLPEEVVRSLTIHDIDSMNETEARAYGLFWEEGLRQYEESGIIARTLLCCLGACLVTFGIFYLYYTRKF